jgi:hypothetical protein
MRICISRQSFNYRWTKGGEDIQYSTSHVMRQSKSQNVQKMYYMMSFTYEFKEKDEKTFFSYCYPYDFSKLTEFLASERLAVRANGGDFMKESVLCQSLGGVDVPIITISSRLNSDPKHFNLVKL